MKIAIIMLLLLGLVLVDLYLMNKCPGCGSRRSFKTTGNKRRLKQSECELEYEHCCTRCGYAGWRRKKFFNGEGGIGGGDDGGCDGC